MSNIKEKATGAYKKADKAAENAAGGIAKRFGTTRTVGYIVLGLAVVAGALYILGII